MVTIEALTKWVREQYVDFVGEDDGVEISNLRLTDAESAKAVRVREYGPDANEDLSEEELTATHCIRFSLVGPGIDLVDGDNWWIRIEGDEIELLTFPDMPSIMGAEMAEVIAWCDQFN